MRCPCAAFLVICSRHRVNRIRRLGLALAAGVRSGPTSSPDSSFAVAERLLAGRTAGALQSGVVQGRPARCRGVAKKMWVKLWDKRRRGGAVRSVAPCGRPLPPRPRARWPIARFGRTRAAAWSTASCTAPPAWRRGVHRQRTGKARPVAEAWVRRERVGVGPATGCGSAVRQPVRSRPEKVFTVRLGPVQIVGNNEGTRRGSAAGSLLLSVACRLSAMAVSVPASLGHVAHERGRQYVLRPSALQAAVELLCRKRHGFTVLLSFGAGAFYRS